MEGKMITQNDKDNIIDHIKIRYSFRLGVALEKYFTQQEKKDERAKKVEELLGLYKELSTVRFYLFCETDADLGQELMNKDDDLNKQIKQLEEELK
jgi:hypothetical protein